jgi:uncharacterized protein YbjT (DUF2867 family)
MIVVLGAFGRTGRVVAALARNQGGQPVRLVSRDAAQKLAVPGAELAVANLSDDAALGRAFRGACAVYAILPDDLRAARFHAERRAMAEAIARALENERVRRVVLLSSLAAGLGEHGNNGFAADLAYFERLIQETNADVTILRACYFQDNVAETLPIAARDGAYPSFFPRGTEITTIAARDVGALAARALLEPSRAHREIIDLVGPAYTPAEIADALGAVLARNIDVFDVPPSYQEAMLRQWMSREAARAMVETLECLAAGRVFSRGDRVERGATELADVLSAAVSMAAPLTASVTRSGSQELRP